MDDMIEFLVIEKLKALNVEFYEASNGIRLVLMKDETLWITVQPSTIVTEETVNAAAVEFLK